MNTLQQIQETGYTNIDYPQELHDLMVTANTQWQAFCEMPAEIKMQLEYANFGGFMLNRNPDHADVKEHLHFTLFYKQKFVDYAHSLDDLEYQKTVLDFTETMTTVSQMASVLIENFITEVGEGLNMDDLASSLMESQDKFILRFLHYFPTEDIEQESAAAHCDIGGFTLHLFQDFPGLQYLDKNKEWQDMSLPGGYTSIFPGIQMQHRTNNQITSTCHRVVPNEETLRTGRYSAVLFNWWEGHPMWNKEECGRMADKELGFNYDLSFEELDKMFALNDMEDLPSLKKNSREKLEASND